MNELMEIIEDLEMLDALHDAGKEAHLDLLLTKYKTRFADAEADMERQAEFNFAQAYQKRLTFTSTDIIL